MSDESPLISLWPWPGGGFFCVGLCGSIPCPGPHHSQAVPRSACCSQALKSTGVMGDLVLNWACLNKKPCALEGTTEERRHTAGRCPDKQPTSGPLPLCETQACEARVRPNEGPFWVTYSDEATWGGFHVGMLPIHALSTTTEHLCVLGPHILLIWASLLLCSDEAITSRLCLHILYGAVCSIYVVSALLFFLSLFRVTVSPVEFREEILSLELGGVCMWLT